MDGFRDIVCLASDTEVFGGKRIYSEGLPPLVDRINAECTINIEFVFLEDNENRQGSSR